jgi:hypothetical protein
MSTSLARRPLPQSEDDFKGAVIDLAKILGWRVCHIRPARTAHGWRTPYEGHPGLPDLILARRGRIVMAELKVDNNRPTLDQKAWLSAAGASGFLWDPSCWDEIRKVLT